VSSSRPPEEFRIPWIEEIRHRTPKARVETEAHGEAVGDISALLGALDRLLNALAEIREDPERPAYPAPGKASVRVRCRGADILELEDDAVAQAREFFGDDGDMRLAVVPGYEISREGGGFTAGVTVRER
jgi:hypothetical protein